MSKLLRYDSTRNVWIYDGLLTAEKKIEVDEIIETIKKEIPEIEKELNKQYKSSVLNKYNLGLILDDYVKKFDLNIKDRRLFWIEIGKLASTEKHTRTENNTSQRNYYEECLALSKIRLDVVEKLSWRHWQSFLDRTDDYDRRLYEWINDNYENLKQETWRQFLKVHHMYMKDKDSSIFDDDEIVLIYDSFLLMAQIWITKKDEFIKNNPKSKKSKTISNKSNKYYEQCFIIKKETKEKYVTEENCITAFKLIVN